MEINQTLDFRRTYKKLHKNQLTVVNEEIRNLAENPNLGEEKVGDLKGVFVYKFKISNQQYLLAYTFDETTLTLIALGVHENFYRSLKNLVNQ